MKSILYSRRRGVSAKVSGSGAPVINAPSGLSIVLIGTTATIGWTNNAGSSAQTSIEHSLNGTSGWAETVLTAAAAQTADVTGLTAGPHYFRLRAKVGTDYSAYAVQTLGATVVFDVANFAASVSGATVNLSWDAHNAGLAQTVIERSANSGATWSVLATVAAGTNAYASTSNASGAYLYRARALIGTIYSSAYTASASATVISVPSSFAASVSGSTITLTWTDTNSGTAQTVIERSTNAGATWTALTTVAAGTNSYVNSSLSSGAYSYRARALIGSTYSSYTSVANATVSSGFSLTQSVLFNGTNGAAVGIVALPNSGELYTSYGGGYGTIYSNAQTRGGRATSGRMTIRQGSDGDPGDAADGYGASTGLWGCTITLPTDCRCVEGDTLHTIMAVYFDADFDFHTPTGLLKFIRFFGTNFTGHLDHAPTTYGYVEADVAHASPSPQTGWMWGNEDDHSGEIYQAGYGQLSGIKSNRIIPLGQWVVIEHRQKFSSNPALASRTTWVNGQFVADFTGNTKTYINAAGSLATLTGGQCKNINPTTVFTAMRLFTYWNGYSPKDQGIYIDRVDYKRFASGASIVLPNTDAYGNAYIGLGVI